jgi:hypothetical protein
MWREDIQSLAELSPAPPSSTLFTGRSFLSDLSSLICLSLTLAAGREPLLELTVTGWGAKQHTTGAPQGPAATQGSLSS